ncbi:LacI family DNA-binding transcriptional regulator [Microbacterium flavum]|uniref:LacI family DNA-binding transcriptional regulator n=1 Tax=Microbacterium flavum TaxID=415216 RepID=A0ABS5XT47_9MICO|nr:LacI family DNA-binding transcriptional regulator [Microbacterium flavum]MBT8797705.1 LacI family DNA-binding transcriptional regulator [Microbacterium flavum]
MLRVTSADVARESGVSRTTVSYVLNATPGAAISDETRRRVLDTAERLGYTPSAAARALRSGRSDIVVCVLPDWSAGPVIDRLLDHLTTLFAEAGLSLLVFHDLGDRPLTHLWRAVTPRAVVALGPLTPADAAAMAVAGIPVVGATLDAPSAPQTFAVPQQAIGALQVGHLVDRGHRVLGYAAPHDDRLEEFAQRRLSGARAASRERGVAEPQVRTVELDSLEASVAVRGWWQAGVTGIVAYNDEVAIAVLAGARAAGLRVPDDLAVIGVDDIPLSRLTTPALTTVWQAIDGQAEHLVGAALDALGHREGGGRPSPSPRPAGELFRVVQRAST